jgi:Clp amino terminal domain, pathogenicity island component
MPWDRLTPPARRAMGRASEESERLGHGYVGDEHVILGLLGEQDSRASSLLRGHGLDLPGARAELQRMAAAGLTPRPHTDDASALRAVGIDVETVRQRLVTAFGAQAVGEAVWRASRRPWWRGGGRRRTPLCGPPFFAKRALQLAAHRADGRGDTCSTECCGISTTLTAPRWAGAGASTSPSSVGPSARSIPPARCCGRTASIRSGCAPSWTAHPDRPRPLPGTGCDPISATTASVDRLACGGTAGYGGLPWCGQLRSYTWQQHVDRLVPGRPRVPGGRG